MERAQTDASPIRTRVCRKSNDFRYKADVGSLTTSATKAGKKLVYGGLPAPRKLVQNLRVGHPQDGFRACGRRSRQGQETRAERGSQLSAAPGI
jgi:hypothetical protein